MKGYNADSIRNIALLGHGGCGKTTFLEAALLKTGVLSRMGKVEDGNTVSDYDKMEIKRDIPFPLRSYRWSTIKSRSTSWTPRVSLIS